MNIMKKIMILCAIIATPVAAFAEPSWETIKAAVKNDIPNRLNGKINLIKIEDAKDGSRWMNRDVYPAAVMYTHSGWVYFSTDEDLPGETYKQKICVNFEKIDGVWVFKSTGVPVHNGFERATPPKKIPPLPEAPDPSIARDAYIAYLKDNFMKGYNPPMETENITIEKFEFTGKPVYQPDPEGYATVTYTCPVTVKYTAVVKETTGFKDRYKTTGEGPAEAIFTVTKKPAKLWYESAKVDKWEVRVIESYTDFHKDQEKLEESSAEEGVESKAGAAASKLKSLFD